jgi:hypothetical protein
MAIWGPKNHKNVENFIGRYDKLSRAIKVDLREKHCGSSEVIGPQDGFYRIKSVGVSQIR